MIIKIFLNSIGHYYQHEMLTKFAEGIAKRNPEDTVIMDLGDEYSHCDVAIIFGSWKERDKGHHIVRSSVANRAKCFVVIETPLVGRKVNEENKYWRVGVDGFLNNQGHFILKSMKSKCTGNRFTKLGLDNFEGWKNDPNGHILLMLQLPGDASLRRTNIYNWAEEVIYQIRSRSNKRIIVRPHPLANVKDGDEFYSFFYKLIKSGHQKIEFSEPKAVPLSQDLNGAYCSISFSSGSSIDSIMSGIPTIACDPGNFAWDISSRYIDQLDELVKVQNKTVEQWLWDLSWYQWTSQEMRTGECWEHIRPICEANLLVRAEEESKETGRRRK